MSARNAPRAAPCSRVPCRSPPRPAALHHVMQFRGVGAALGHGLDQFRRGLAIAAAEELDHLVGLAEKAAIPDRPGKDRAKRQHAKRDQHYIGAFMGMLMCVLVTPRLAPEGKEHKPPAVE